MTATKRKISVSLDADLVAELEASDESLSTQINEAVRISLEERRRHRLLAEMLDEMEKRDGPVDEALVQKFMDLLA
jgi:metal-responsive CopG/Arc/MetJ family transcriptional regulator